MHCHYLLQAERYGFKKIVSIQDLAHHHPTQYPFHHYEARCVEIQVKSRIYCHIDPYMLPIAMRRIMKSPLKPLS